MIPGNTSIQTKSASLGGVTEESEAHEIQRQVLDGGLADGGAEGEHEGEDDRGGAGNGERAVSSGGAPPPEAEVLVDLGRGSGHGWRRRC